MGKQARLITSSVHTKHFTYIIGVLSALFT